MVDVRWHFREMRRGELNQNPMEREFFTAEAINERLVREVIQNSLDAGVARLSGASGEPVRVRFSLGGIHAPLDGISAADYLDGLGEHLKVGLDSSDDFRRRVATRGLDGADMPYLVIEDAGTVGLEGDWQRYDDSDEDPADNEHFYWFFRNVARSGKSDDEGGSWGLGKWVFPDASRASAYIAVTRRRSDGETLLMGQTVLTKHNVDGQRYAPYGYFAEMDDDLAVPLRMSEPSHRAFIRQCISDFDLRFRDQAGLSVIIPFPRTDGELPIDRAQILAAVIHNYFYPIISGRLVVTVDERADSESTEVTSDTIDDVLAHLALEDSGERSVGSYQRLFEMCRTRAIWPERTHIHLNSPPQNKPAYEHHQELSDLRSRYEGGEMLAFRINTMVERKGESTTPERTSFRLYVQHDGSLTQGHDFYVRGALSITEMDEILQHKARTLLVVDEREPLAAMLRDSEPPAHTMWYPQSERVGKRWISARRCITEVRRAANNLLSIWEAKPVELNRDALADIFPSSGHGEKRRSADKTGAISPKHRQLDLAPGHPDFSVDQSGKGFRVRFATNTMNPPNRVRLRVAYEVPRGNPMKSYSPHDFRLHGAGSLEIHSEGCSVIPGENGNELLLDIDDPTSFFVAVRGFDTHRDVVVRVNRVETSIQEDGATS
ncbi:MAG: hypothetical protein F4X64_03060 [Chloroflexi bacterium]|nr:hypothetical protein [Chloroflexota bacterium]